MSTPASSEWIEVERILPLIQEHIENHNYVFQKDRMVGGNAIFAEQTGLSPKFVYEVTAGRKTRIHVDRLEAILLGTDQQYLANWPKEKGGFADFYDNLEPSPKRKQYPSDFKAPAKTKCRCGASKEWRSKACKACYLKLVKAKTKKCKDCKAVLNSGRGKTAAVRCWPCWCAHRKDRRTKASKAFEERHDGIARVLKRQPAKRQKKVDAKQRVR